jgi:hypothetical protein
MIQVKAEERPLNIERSLGENQKSGGWFACCSASLAARFMADMFKHMKLKSTRSVEIISTLQMSITMFTSSQMPKMLILTTKKIDSYTNERR